MSTSERTPLEFVKSVNGLEKVVLREIHGSSVEDGDFVSCTASSS
ncbi:hypothetical protein Hanom_Chr10g00953701 [Helianthus anomalus]